MSDRPLIAFCHIIKAAGTTFTDLLKRNFGVSHLQAEPLAGFDIYSEANLARDLKALPWLKSISGHALRPYTDYSSIKRRLIWISWMRDPVNRLISSYQHGVERNNLKEPFDVWLDRAERKNRNIYFLTGTDDDLEGAKRVIQEKLLFMGSVEHFDLSLVMLKTLLNKQFDIDLDIRYSMSSNTARKGSIATSLKREICQYQDLISSQSAADIELYNWLVQYYLPGRIAEVKDVLAESYSLDVDLANYSASGFHGITLVKNIALRNHLSGFINHRLNYALRHTLYKPFLSRMR